MRLRVTLAPSTARAFSLSLVQADERDSFVHARDVFRTAFVRQVALGGAPDAPSAGVFDVIVGSLPLGRNASNDTQTRGPL